MTLSPHARTYRLAMNATTFDTLRAAKRLKDLGFDERQAEGVAEMLRETPEADAGQFVTKEYLDHRLTALEQRLVIKLGSMVVVAVGVMTALVKLL